MCSTLVRVNGYMFAVYQLCLCEPIKICIRFVMACMKYYRSVLPSSSVDRSFKRSVLSGFNWVVYFGGLRLLIQQHGRFFCPHDLTELSAALFLVCRELRCQTVLLLYFQATLPHWEGQLSFGWTVVRVLGRLSYDPWDNHCGGAGSCRATALPCAVEPGTYFGLL